MKLGVHIGYWGLGIGSEDQLKIAQEAERLGYDSVWAAEAYGSDTATVRGEHRADAAMAVRVGAHDDPIVASDSLEHGLARSHRQGVDRAPQVRDAPAGGVAIPSHKL